MALQLDLEIPERPLRIRRPRQFMYPAGIVADLIRALRHLVDELYKHLMEHWKEIVILLEKARTLQEDEATRRVDAPIRYVGTITEAELTELWRRLKVELPEAWSRDLMREIYRRVSAHVVEGLKAAAKEAVPDFPGAISGLSRLFAGAVTARGAQLEALIKQRFLEESVSLIKSIPEQFHERVKRDIWEAITTGMSAKELQERLRTTYNVTKSRAELIARDQVGKLFGNLNRVRQMDAGIWSFYWRTVGDNRVRPSHRALEGKEFPWETGAPGGLYPGMEYQCRCWAQPVFRPREEAAVGAEIEKEEEELKLEPLPPKAEHLPTMPSVKDIEQAKTMRKILSLFERMGFSPHVVSTMMETGSLEHAPFDPTGQELELMREAAKAFREMAIRYGLAANHFKPIPQPLVLCRRLLDVHGGDIHGVYWGKKLWGGDNRFAIIVDPFRVRNSLSRRTYVVTREGGFKGMKFFTISLDPRVVGNDPRKYIRMLVYHEFGHAVEELLPDEMRKELESIYNRLKQTNAFLSIYSGKNPAEMWAEAWGFYHSDAFRPGVLDKQLENLLRKAVSLLMAKPKKVYRPL